MEIDWSVGEIIKTLKKEGIDDNTLVIFTSDNGPWLSYGTHGGSALPLREGKGTAWEGGVREPCIMRWPGKIKPGTTCDIPCMNIDLLPTLANLIGAEPNQPFVTPLNPIKAQTPPIISNVQNRNRLPIGPMPNMKISGALKVVIIDSRTERMMKNRLITPIAAMN